MAANRLTGIAIEALTQAAQGNPNARLTAFAVEALVPNLNAPDPAPAVTFSLQKLVLTVKEAPIPVRGRNQ